MACPVRAGFPTTTVFSAGGTVVSVDWSPADRIIALGLLNTASDELQVLRFTNNTLASVITRNDNNVDVNAVRWGRDLYNLAVGRKASTGFEFVYYRFNSTNATFVSTNGIHATNGVTAIAWGGMAGTSNRIAVGTADAFVQVSRWLKKD